MPTVEVGPLSLYYERSGEGQPLLFISGTGGDLRHRPNVFQSPLAGLFDLLAYDQRGLGQSSVPEGPWTMADYAADAAGLLQAVGWESALVCGLSFGGMVAQELAIRYPSLVRRLVLCCTSPGGAGGSSYPLHELEMLDADERAEHHIEIMDTRWNARWRARHEQQAKAMVEGFKAYLKQNASGDMERELGAHLQLEARRTHDTWDRLRGITCPTLVCAGRFDGIAPPANSENLVARIPKAKLVLFDGGHQFLLQDKAAFTAIEEFLVES
ncbi:MAG TPA: alpha/beta fold hydrolase [Acidimicrobiales bacterium]|jgi:3-oxoadipate enol-lactonase|nr:alpha/beta fold hydrolase [Acidimicrobiales bacterium]